MDPYSFGTGQRKGKCSLNYEKIRHAYGETDGTALSTPLFHKLEAASKDKFLGCIIGGAAGDALGYTVEFMSEQMIFLKYGEQGIAEYQLEGGLARFSDDTQMTLFTANGLLLGLANEASQNQIRSCISSIAEAYREWYRTQTEPAKNAKRPQMNCWLMNVADLFVPRAPGSTCMHAISEGCCGQIEKPVNSSKGCGGVMRVAPIGLCFGNTQVPILTSDLLAADAAALTHGHEMGYIPAALLAHIIRLLSHSDQISPLEAVQDGLQAVQTLFPDAEYMPGFVKHIERAIEYTQKDVDDLTAIHALGEGWTGDQAIAIAVYCAVKYSDDFEKAIVAAVNHAGDSDSTGALVGNILGAYLGLSQIPDKYIDKLELVDVLKTVADDLYSASVFLDKEQEAATDSSWREKYVKPAFTSSGEGTLPV